MVRRSVRIMGRKIIMNLINREGNLPTPLRRFGIYSLTSKINEIWSKYGLPAIYECNSVGELGNAGHLDDCAFQVLIDRDRDRFYLVAMSVDLDRTKAKVEETELGIQIMEDTGPKPPTIIYYVEISPEEYRIWKKEDRNQRISWLKSKARIENKSSYTDTIL